MQLLCVTALLLSAVTAIRPWQDEKFLPAGGPRLDVSSKRGDSEPSVTPVPGGGDSVHPVWPHEMPTWLKPCARPGNGNPQGPKKRPFRFPFWGQRQPDSWRPWQDEKFLPAGGPRQDADPKRGDSETSGTPAPEDRGDGDCSKEDPVHPVWPHEIPTWLRPCARPGNGNPQGPKKGTNGNDRQPGRPSQVLTRGKRQALDFMPDDEPGSGQRKGFKRPRGPPRDKWSNPRNPGARGNMVFSPTFKLDSVTFQSITSVALKEGENVFLMPKRGRRGPLRNKQYVKLIYSTTEPNKVSIEYGIAEPMKIVELGDDEGNPEEADW